jgi:integrase
MTGFVDRAVKRPPETLTEDEQATLLRVTGEHRNGYRDHMIFSFALGTALREFELTALNVGDVFDADLRPRRVVVLNVYKGHKKGGRPAVPQEVFIPEALRRKLETFVRWKRQQGESLDVDAPMFVSRRIDKSSGNGAKKRLSERMLLQSFVNWQKRAGFDRAFRFHSLRHTALTNLYRATRDIRVVQRQARHTNIVTTTIYAGPSDEDLSSAVEGLPC